MKLKEYPLFLKEKVRLSTFHFDIGKIKKEDYVPVIVSFTAIPSRFSSLHLTIKSLLKQSKLPKKILLWVDEKSGKKLPSKVLKLQNDIFEIHTSPYTFSHKKLIHTLKLFPDDIVVTVDDDLIYDKYLIENLYKSHLENKDVVIGNRCREITYKNNKLLPYIKWPFRDEKGSIKEEKNLMPVGAFGILYPPHILSEIVFDMDLLQKLSPKSDDLWFKTCTLLNGKKSIVATIKHTDFITPIPFTQKVALKKYNNKLDKKREQWETINSHFKLL